MTTIRIFQASTKTEDLGLMQVEPNDIMDTLRDLAAEFETTVFFRDPTTDKIVHRFNPKTDR